MPAKSSSIMERLGSLGRAILDSLPPGVLMADERGKVIYANQAFGQICGCNVEEIIGMNILAADPQGVLAQVYRTKQPIQGKKCRPFPSKEEVLVHSFCVHDEGQFVGAVLFVHEATEAMAVLAQLVKAQQVLETLSQKVERMGKAPYVFEDIVGCSNRLYAALAVARRAAVVDTTVLLRGESGTGKELFAAAIHNASRRSHGPFIHVNCAAIPDTLLESEFFGYEKGAFTGAVRRKLGMFELADGGTIFLDEIGDLDLKLQAKLLQVLQNGEFRKVGGTATLKVDVRVIAATNRNLEELIQKGLFRRDLYFRLNVIEIVLPPLRERKEDIPLLADHLLGKIGRRIGKHPTGITPEALRKLCQYCWPGNVRELENVLERALTMAPEGSPLRAEDIYLPGSPASGTPDADEVVNLAEWEKIMIARALAKYGVSVEAKRKAAQALGISLSTLYGKLKQYGWLVRQELQELNAEKDFRK